MSIAADYEFFSRPEWAALRTACEFNFRQQRQMQPDFMCAAVASGEVDVIAGYTRRADREIRSCRARRSQRRDPAYDAILLMAPKRAGDWALREALLLLISRVDIAAMREANL